MIKLIKFAIVGGSGSLVLLGVLFALTEWVGIFYLLSYSMAFLSAVISNYFLNTRWTFRAVASWAGLFKYLTISIITICFNLLMVWLLTEYMHLWYMLSAAIGIGTAFLINYVAARKIVWAK